MAAGELFRPTPGVSLVVPGGWHFKESYTVLAPDGQANVIVSSEPLDLGLTGERYAEIQGGLLHREFPQFEQYGPLQPITLHGLSTTAWLRDFSWRPPEGVTVRQIQLYAVRSGRGFTATATTPAAQADRFFDLFREVLRMIVVNEPAADSLVAFTPWGA